MVNERLAEIKIFKKPLFGKNLSAKEYLKRRETQEWVKKKVRGARENADREEQVNRMNIEFAKNLFISWDDDGSETLEAKEMIKYLVQLGLAPDSNFARKIIDSLDPRSKAEKEKTDLRLTLQDFIKIFKSSKVSEQLLNVINRESLKRQAQNLVS